MEYIFIINPAAGKNKKALDMIPDIQNVCNKLNVKFQIHLSQSGEDISNFVRKTCSDNDFYRFYAIGGDGTLSHVVNGVINYKNVSVGVIPMGTGNDFIKNFSINFKDFLNIEKQILGKELKIDTIKYNNKFCINIVNIGFDASVATDMPKFKKSALVTNSAAYKLSILYNVLKKLGRHIEVYTDDKLFFKGNMLMCAISNGSNCGGGFAVTPKAKINDGIIDLSLVTPPTRLQLGTFVKHITAGTHLENPNMTPYIYYTKCKKVRVISPRKTFLVNDGEAELFNDVTFEIHPMSINFILPNVDN